MLGIIVFFLLTSFTGYFCDSICGYVIPKPIEIVTNVDISTPSVSRVSYSVAGTPPNNLRIFYSYTNAFNQVAGAELIKSQVMEPARIQLEKLIVPRYPAVSPIKVDRSCEDGVFRVNNGVRGCSTNCTSPTVCSGIHIPEEFLKRCLILDEQNQETYVGTGGPGAANSDIVLMVTSVTCPARVIAYAASCFQDKYDRPILGFVNICPGMIIASTSINENIKTIKHEIIHALGFAVDKFAFYRYSNGNPIVPRNAIGFPNLGLAAGNAYYNWNEKIAIQTARPRQSLRVKTNRTFTGLVLPKVLETARSYFKCASLNSVDLEDFGSIGSAFSHFDELVFNNEMMTPTTNNANDVLSNLTLALLEDTGWYLVDYSKAERFLYGAGLGCTFATDGCYTFMQQQISRNAPISPYCDFPLQSGKILSCSANRDYFQFCDLRKMHSVPLKYQYFSKLPTIAEKDVQLYSGAIEFNEFCPVYRVFKTPSFVCSDASNNDVSNSNIAIPSHYGNDSMCFETILPANKVPVFGASCQRFQTINGSLFVVIQEERFQCSNPITQITVNLSATIQATLTCPEFISTSGTTSIVATTMKITTSPTTSTAKQVVTQKTARKSAIKSTKTDFLLCIIIHLGLVSPIIYFNLLF